MESFRVVEGELQVWKLQAEVEYVSISLTDFYKLVDLTLQPSFSCFFFLQYSFEISMKNQMLISPALFVIHQVTE